MTFFINSGKEQAIIRSTILLSFQRLELRRMDEAASKSNCATKLTLAQQVENRFLQLDENRAHEQYYGRGTTQG